MNGCCLAEQDGHGYLFFQYRLAGSQDSLVVSLGKDDLPGFSLRLVNHHARDLVGLAQMTLEALAVFGNVNRFLGHSGFDRGLGDGRGLPHQHTWIKRFRDQVIGTELEARDSVGAAHRVRHIFLGQICQGAGGSKLHLFVNHGGTHVQGAAEDEGESKNVVHLVGKVRTPGGYDDVIAARLGLFIGDFGIRVGQSEDDGARSHRTHHLRGNCTLHGQAEKHIGVFHGLGQSAKAGTGCEALFVGIHARGTALEDHSLGVTQNDIFAPHAETNVVLSACHAGSPRAVYHHADLADVLAYNFQPVKQRRARNNCSAMLVIVKDRNLHRFLQTLFDVEAFRRLDVFQVDGTEGGFQQLADFDDLVGILTVDFNVEDIHVGKTFEQDSLAFHHGFAGKGTDVAQTEDCSSVAHDRYQIAARCVFESIVW